MLHHIGPLAGAALFAGATGTILFAVLGLVAAIPFLLRLHRRFGNWRAPGIAVAIFAIVFTFSTALIAPAINGDQGGDSGSAGSPPAQATESTKSSHATHH